MKNLIANTQSDSEWDLFGRLRSTASLTRMLRKEFAWHQTLFWRNKVRYSLSYKFQQIEIIEQRYYCADTPSKFPENCPCYRHPKLKQRLYLKRRFDYGKLMLVF